MKNTISSSAILGAILKKDLLAYSRNKLYIFLTVIGIIFFVLIFWVTPDTVDETIVLGITPSIETMLENAREELIEDGIQQPQFELFSANDIEKDLATEEGMQVLEFEDAEQMKKVLEGKLKLYVSEDGTLESIDPQEDHEKKEQLKDAEEKDLHMGLAFPLNFVSEAIKGEKTEVTIYLDAAVPNEMETAMQAYVREIAFLLGGHESPVEFPEEEAIILGHDRAGQQISMQERMRPLLALFILLIETFAMASLISGEILQGTVTALRVTPMKVGHFLAAKTILGTCLALSQGVLILLLIRAFTVENWHILLITMLLGSLLFTSVAMIIGAAGKDFMGQLMYAILFTVPLMIPAFAVLVPGTVASWVQIIPSYPIVELLVGSTIYEVGWLDYWNEFFYAILWVAALYLIGLVILKRKVETL